MNERYKPYSREGTGNALPGTEKRGQSGRSRQRSRRLKRRSRKIFLLGGLAALLLISAVLLLHYRTGIDELHGTWALDSVTVYEFDGKGRGSLILPLRTYPFRYTLKENKLSIDFSEASLTDAVYSFTAEKDTLILTGLKGEVYTFSRQE